MTRFANRAVIAGTSGTMTLVTLLSAVAALTPAAMAQVAGGSEHGVGAPLGVDPALLVRPGPVEPARCIHRSIDLRRSLHLDDNRLTVWLTVKLPVIAVVKVSGTASGSNSGTIAITVIRDGIPIADSPIVHGADLINTDTKAYVSLIPGRQYKFSAKAVVNDKRLDLFDFYVGVGKTCP